MYSVFLVEDEIVIREGIKNLIAWNEYGFSFLGEATDGEIAWPLIQKEKPDIVITDIKMPFMDGLVLSRLIKKDLPQTKIIILSGYDDFSYAKEAISIGVSQYLLKPLSKDQLIEVLCEVKERKDKEEQHNRYLAQFNNEVQEYLSTSRRGFLDALISGKYTVSEILTRADKLGVDLTAECYNFAQLLLEDLLQTEYSAQLAKVQSDLCECFSENKNIIMFSIGIDMILFLIKADAEHIDVRSKQCVDILSEICNPLGETATWSVMVGQPVRRLSELPKCYRAVCNEMFHGIADSQRHIHYVGNKTVSRETSVVDFNPNDMDANQMDQRIVEKFLASGLKEDVDAFVHEYFTCTGRKAMESMMFRQYVVLNIQFTVNAFLEKLDYDKETIRDRQEDGLKLKDAVISLESSENYIHQILAWAIELRDKAVNRRYSSMLKKTLDYMKLNFCDPDINLNVVARVANISATHFSAVFSQQMDKTFVEYLTELRMERARELLSFTDKSSGDIAFEVGYNDPHYFSFLFKKLNGCSPRDYRSGRKFS